MTGTQRLLAVVIAGAMLVGGFAFGRMAETPKTNAEEGKTALVNSTAPEVAPQAASENQAFYLTDYKTGYDEGYNAGMNGVASGVNNTTRAGFNEGFKEGYADGYQARANQQTVSESARPVATGNRFAQQQVVYRPVTTAKRSGNSKLKTALTIAAPAAIGAGIGAAAGGKKGAAVGALVGGGGGALYHLIKNRDRN
jgi:hypothetical protein